MGLVRHEIRVTREVTDVYEVYAQDIAKAHQVMQRALDELPYELVKRVYSKLKREKSRHRITGIDFNIFDTKDEDEISQAGSGEAPS